MPHNAEQDRAISFTSKKDLVITAGAGSGKTMVLSERVFHLVDSGEITPESLLVLTFTNNASYEMKTRILEVFGKDHPLYPRMLSCHVQSFDSFRAYLVRTYAEALNVPKTFVLMPESVEEEKRSHIVEEVVEECFANPEKRRELTRFLTRFGFKNIDMVQDCVLYLSRKLSDHSPSERESFVASYKASFHSDSALLELYRQQILDAREKLSDILREALFVERYGASLEEAVEGEDFDRVRSFLSSTSLWTAPLDKTEIENVDDPSWGFLAPLYLDLRDLLTCEETDFVSEAKDFNSRNEDAFKHPVKQSKTLDKETHRRCKAVYSVLKKAAGILSTALSLGSFEEAKEKALWCKEDELFLLGLAKESSDRLGVFKRSVNAFSFADIGFLALRLFQDDSLREQAQEIASRFDYVMVDEYQDNNDGQEALLAGLTAIRPDGSRAHLFCVGDAKQAIYAFRGSNVELIRNRARAYSSSPEGEVIAMNKNYRSASRLLSDINYIFSSYMRMDNGGVDYLDPAERLQYDEAANPYQEDAGNYGVRRILPPGSFALQSKNLRLEKGDQALYEATAILHDIQKKKTEGHLVYDRKAKCLRKCKNSDFVILVRRRKQIPVYQRLFTANDIPLNNQLSEDLREVTPTVLLRSLLGLLANRLYDQTRDDAHLFASVARSYAFHYDDTRIHEILTGKGIEGDYDDAERVRMALSADPIMMKIDAFASNHRDASFETILLDLLSEFNVVSALPRLEGRVDAYLSKIDSLFSMALSERDLGAGLSDFIAFFDSLDEYGIDLKSETISESADAVGLMTIHASKGLERKIVYMPASESGLGRGDARNEPPFVFSEQRGIVFSYLGYEIKDEVDPEIEMGGSIQTIRTLGVKDKEQDEERQEHVRILYVALTRAENAFYLVGKETSNSGYLMMKDLPKSIAFNPAFLEMAKKEGCFDSDAFATIKRLDEELPKLRISLSNPDGREITALEKDIQEACVFSPLLEKRNEAYYQFLVKAYEHYLSIFEERAEDLDFLADIFARTFYPQRRRQRGIEDFATLVREIGGRSPESMERGINVSFVFPKEENEWKELLSDFAKGILERNLASFAPFANFSKEATKPGGENNETARRIFVDHLLPVFLSRFEGIDYIAYESYACESYRDDVDVFDQALFQGQAFIKEPTLPLLTIDDRELSFEPMLRKRASKEVTDPDLRDSGSLERGTHLHRLLELSKLDENALDFIVDPKEKALILRCLRLDLLQKAKRGTRYPEYGYYDTDFDTTGFIDLLFFEEDGTCHIVDYKTYDIDDPSYVEQLHSYRRNVARLFKIKESDIRLHLLSIAKAVVKDVA